MNIVAINGSNKGRYGNTYMMLEWLATGISEESGQLDIINLREYTINECRGCYSCWIGEKKCPIKDDINNLIQKILTADLIIFASPVFCHNITITMKKFLDRFIMMSSNLTLKFTEDEEYIHNVKYCVPPFVILSSCNLNEYNNFSTISSFFKTYAKHIGTKVVDEIYRTQFPVLKIKGEVQQILKDNYIKIIVNAGRELVLHKELTFKTRQLLKRNLVKPIFYQAYVEENDESKVVELM